MDDQQTLVEVIEALPGEFGLTPARTGLVHLDSAAILAELRERLAEKITGLLDRDRYRLMSILYRIDVREDRVKAALAAPEPGQIPFLLADLIIERQLQKIRIRRKYRNGGA